MKIESFTGGATAALGVLVAKITIGPKTMYLAFFIVDAKPTYSVLLGRDWIHASQFLPCPFAISFLEYMLTSTLFFWLVLDHFLVHTPLPYLCSSRGPDHFELMIVLIVDSDM